MALSTADQLLLDQITAGDDRAWAQLIERYQGRLLAFARRRVRSESDAEDLVQDAFMQFLKSARTFRGEASLETMLFLILRRRIIDLHRKPEPACSINDSRLGPDDDSGYDPASPRDLTASTYVRRDESNQLAHVELSRALLSVIEQYRNENQLLELQIAEMVFYCQLPNKRVAELCNVAENRVAVLKHRWIDRIRTALGDVSQISGELSDALLTRVWEDSRPSCPKRNTIGAFVLKTLDPTWMAYIDLHINTLGCRFCRANVDDLQSQLDQDRKKVVHDRIMQSTVGFLKK